MTPVELRLAGALRLLGLYPRAVPVALWLALRSGRVHWVGGEPCREGKTDVAGSPRPQGPRGGDAHG